MRFEAVRMFLGVQGILYHGEGVKPTLAVSYSHKLMTGVLPKLTTEAHQLIVGFGERGLNGFIMAQTSFSQT
jgi:hypothetical protein